MVNRRGRKRGSLVGTRSRACKGTNEENTATRERRLTRNSSSKGGYLDKKTDDAVEEDEMIIEKSISGNEDDAMENSKIAVQSKDEAKTTGSANFIELVNSRSVEGGSNDASLPFIADNDEEGNKLDSKLDDECVSSNDNEDVGEALNSCSGNDDQTAETIKDQKTMNNQQRSSANPKKGAAQEIVISAEIQQSDNDKSVTERKIDETIIEENSVNDSGNEDDATENDNVAIQNKDEVKRAGTANDSESVNSCNVEVGSDDASLPSTAENDEEGNEEVDSNDDDESMGSNDEVEDDDDDGSEISNSCSDDDDDEEKTVENIKDQKKLKKQQKSPSKPKKGEARKLSKFQGTEKLSAQGQQSDTATSATKNKKNKGEPEKETPPAKKRFVLDEKYESLVKERKEEREERSLFLKNLPPNTTSEQLKKLSPEIVYVRIPMEHGKNLQSLYAFIEFENKETCDKNYKKILGKKINNKKFTLDFCGERSMFKKKEKVPLPVNRKRLFISNLPTEITTDELRQHIPDATNFHPRIRGTKRYMFISFADEEKAQKAFEEAGKLVIKGKKLTVLFAFRKKSGRNRKAVVHQRRKPKIVPGGSTGEAD